ncbi:MAG: hypothetical protein H7346_01340 [Burkholderiaceae bacterium]|nr:hypothetical protein [Burkholderiaceae bacterium]
MQQVLDRAKAAGLGQGALAQAAGISPETLSRAKKRDTMDLATLAALAETAGLEICLQPSRKGSTKRALAKSALADPSWGLAWSNPDVSNEVLVRNALLRGAYAAVLQAVLDCGMDFVEAQWALMNQPGQEGLTRAARANVPRMLKNISKGLHRAST